MAGGAGGVGAAQDHLRAMRSLELGARRRPKRLAAFRGKSAGDAEPVERLPVPAAWWCGECGYLLPPTKRERPDRLRGDPMRRAVVDEVDERCPHCGETGWIDFGVVPLAMRVRDDDSTVARRRRTRVVIGARVAAGGVVLAMWLAGAAMWVSLSAIAVLGAVTMIVDRVGSAVVRARRWHRPTRAWSRGGVRASGSATGTTVVAPLTGRPAIAWVVAAREGGADPERRVRSTNDADWALVEQRCGTLAIDGQEVSGEPVIDVRLQEVEFPSAEAREWLRTRGLEAEDLQVFEGIVAAGDVVTLHANRRGDGAVCTAG